MGLSVDLLRKLLDELLARVEPRCTCIKYPFMPNAADHRCFCLAPPSEKGFMGL